MNENTIQYYSQIGQDKFVLDTLKHKRNGFFVDIGTGPPRHLSNTYTLETQFDWTGIGIDIKDASEDENIHKDDPDYKKLRPNTHYVIENALNIDYSKLFKQYNAPKIIDYLTIDIDPPELSLECLFLVPINEYRFSTITFETDEYRMQENFANKSREYLKKNNYMLVNSVNRQDDFYISYELYTELTGKSPC